MMLDSSLQKPAQEAGVARKAPYTKGVHTISSHGGPHGKGGELSWALCDNQGNGVSVCLGLLLILRGPPLARPSYPSPRKVE